MTQRGSYSKERLAKPADPYRAMRFLAVIAFSPGGCAMRGEACTSRLTEPADIDFLLQREYLVQQKLYTYEKGVPPTHFWATEGGLRALQDFIADRLQESPSQENHA